MPLLTLVLFIIVGIILVKFMTSVVMELFNMMLNVMIGCLGWVILMGLFCGFMMVVIL